MQRLLQKKMSQDEDGEVQDFASLKRIKRAAESDEKNIIFFYPSRASLTIKMFYPLVDYITVQRVWFNVLVFHHSRLGCMIRIYSYNRRSKLEKIPVRSTVLVIWINKGY